MGNGSSSYHYCVYYTGRRWREVFATDEGVAWLERSGCPLIVWHSRPLPRPRYTIDQAVKPHSYRGRSECCMMCLLPKTDPRHSLQTETLL